MAAIALPENLIRRLEEIAQRENRPGAELIATMVERYEPQPLSQEDADAALEAIFGIFDDDVTDMSTTVRATLQEYFKKKYGSPD